jgi:hypothetical protein
VPRPLTAASAAAASAPGPVRCGGFELAGRRRRRDTRCAAVFTDEVHGHQIAERGHQALREPGQQRVERQRARELGGDSRQ